MKKIKLVIHILAALMFVAGGCSDDFLKEKGDLSGVNEEVFQDPLVAQAYVDYIYYLFLPGNNAQSMTWELATGNAQFTQTTEELAGETNWNKDWAQISNDQNHAIQYFGSKMSTSIGNNTWTRMKQINLFLENIDKHGIEESVRNKLKGQMYFWRAWQYFDLVKLYGGVPLVLTPQDPIQGDVEAAKIPRSKTSEVIDQISSDLDKAIELLPGKWDEDNWGRITSGAAAAFKGRVLLTWASPLFNRSDDQTRWQKAYDANLAAKTLLEQNGFELYDNGGFANGEAWGKMWFDDVDNPEAVIVYNFNDLTTDQTRKNNGWEQAVRPRSIGGGGSISPTKQMVDAFPMKDGKMPGESTYAYEENKFFKNRDPRFYKTFVYNGAKWPYKEDKNFRLWSYSWFKSASSTKPDIYTEKNPNASGIYLCKASDPNASTLVGGSSNFSVNGHDYMELRFAEVILNLAESAIGVNKLSEGLDGIKAIRERAGVENVDGNFGVTATTRNELFAAVLNERKIEFAYEGKRFWDLRRWMLFDNNSSGTLDRLGMQPLNGIRRTGYHIVVKKADGSLYTGSKDPLILDGINPAPVAERKPANLDEKDMDAYVESLYDTYFEVRVKDDLDKTNPADWDFTWYPEYYFFGLHKNILEASPYLEQTVGWNSVNGPGTFDPLE